MATTDILLACLEALDGFVYQPQPAVLMPGLKEDPPSEGFWLVPSFFPNETVNVSWGITSCSEFRGFFQIRLYFRANPRVGSIAPSRLADALIDHFPKGTVFGPVRVSKRPWQSPLVVEDASKNFIPITIPYLGLTGEA